MDYVILVSMAVLGSIALFAAIVLFLVSGKFAMSEDEKIIEMYEIGRANV